MKYTMPTLRSLFSRKAILPRRRKGESFRPRFLAAERLETRAMLAADLFSGWQNHITPTDVNADGYTTAIDALNVINELNAAGPRELAATPAQSISRASFMAAGEERTTFLDVNGDGILSTIDALAVINKLNAAQDEKVQIRIEITDLNGNPVENLLPGQEFQLRGLVKDLREPQNDPQRGVFSAYVDVHYETAKTMVDLDGRSITYGDPTDQQSLFPNGQRLTSLITATPGKLEDIGAFSNNQPYGSQEEVIFVVPMQAGTMRGVTSFMVEDDMTDLFDTSVYGSNEGVMADEIIFVGDQVIIGTPPTTVNDTATVAEDSQANSIDVVANDTVHPQGQGPLTLFAVAQGAHGSVTVIDGSAVYTPAADFFGEDTFTYTVQDANGEQAVGTVSVTITSVNDPPTANDDTRVVDTDSTDNDIFVLDNDSFAPDVGETLTISDVGLPNRNGTVTIGAGDMRIVYTPAPGFVGTETFTYTISDGNGLTDQATVTVTVKNDNPRANPDNFTTGILEDSVDNELDVLENDELAPGIEGMLLITGVGPRSNGGTVTIAPGNTSLLYTPAPDFAGTETFTYHLIDGQGGEADGMVSVTVTGVNDPPTANDDQFPVPEDQQQFVLRVLNNDTFAPDTGEVLLIDDVSIGSEGGTLSISPLRDVIFYTPRPDFVGVETFTYTITDGSGETDTATVTANVFDVSENPIAVDDEAVVGEDSVNNVLNVLANDSDPDPGDILTISSVSTGSRGGRLTISLDRQSVSYSPALNLTGVETFTYIVGDQHDSLAAGIITFTIVPVNDPPIAANDTKMVPEGSTNNPIDVLANDSTPDEGETLTIVEVGNPSAGGTVMIAGDNLSLIYTPDPTFSGTETFTYTISDGTGMEATATVTVTVMNVNNPPMADDDLFNVDEDSAATMLDLLENDTSDPDTGETLTITSVGPTEHGGIVVLADDHLSVTYTPAANFHGEDTFTYTISDGNGGTDTATVTVQVAGVNDPPPAVNDAATVAEDSGATMIDVLTNDTPNPDAPETVTIQSVGPGSEGGTITLAADHLSVSYTPRANFNGTETFTYTVTDGELTSMATVTVTVTAVNDAPTLGADTFEVNRDTTNNTLNVLANDSGAPDTGETLTITAVGATNRGGTVTIAPDGKSLRYTPAAGFVGAETFTYTVSDGTVTATQTVTVNVKFQVGSLAGFVYVDANNNAVKENGEQALANVTIRLWGTDVLGHSVNITTTTDSTGAYRFSNVMPGSYVIEETQPDIYMDGTETLGTQGGVAGHDQFFIALAAGQNGTGNNFGERGLRPEFIGRPNFFVP